MEQTSLVNGEACRNEGALLCLLKETTVTGGLDGFVGLDGKT